MNLDIYAKSLQFEDGRQLLIQKLDFVKKMYVVVDKINLCVGGGVDHSGGFGHLP